MSSWVDQGAGAAISSITERPGALEPWAERAGSLPFGAKGTEGRGGSAAGGGGGAGRSTAGAGVGAGVTLTGWSVPASATGGVGVESVGGTVVVEAIVVYRVGCILPVWGRRV